MTSKQKALLKWAKAAGQIGAYDDDEKVFYFCRLCGKQDRDLDFEDLSFGRRMSIVCDDCHSRMLQYAIRKLVANRARKERVYCVKCYSHINACICKESKQMGNLKL